MNAYDKTRSENTENRPVEALHDHPELLHGVVGRRNETVAKDKGMIAVSYDDLQESIGRLDHALAMLIKHIDPVLTADRSEPDSEAKALDPAGSDIANGLTIQVEKLREMTRTVHRVMDRVDL